MTEEFILQYIPKRIQQLGYRNYHIRYRDMNIKMESEIRIPAYTDLWFIVDDPLGFVIESDYGIYDTSGEFLFDNTHQHKGEILVKNVQLENKRIKFIQVIIVN
jgi:hypothetical protein